MITAKKNAVRIPCNSTVKNYTVATLKRLGLDAGPGKVYNNVRSGKGFLPKNNLVVNKLIETLLNKIPLFLPPVPPTAAELERFRAFNEKWSESLRQLTVNQVIPVYLRGEVNKELKRRGYPQCCKRIHLVWCLSLKGEAFMSPKKVADAIIEYDGTNWSSVPPLKNDSEYHVRLRENTEEEKKIFLDTIEFIFSLKGNAADVSLVEKLQNDIDVLTEFEEWGKNLESYKYIERYEEFVRRLQTAPVAQKKRHTVAKPKKSAAQKQKECCTIEPKDVPADLEKIAAPIEQQVLHENSTEGTKETIKVVHEPICDDGSPIPHNTENSTLSTDVYFPDREQWEENYAELENYLSDITKNDQTGKQKISEIDRLLVEFCKFTNFQDEFADLQRLVNGRSFNKGGYAAGIIRNKVIAHRHP